jgi:hypothetical protein
LFSPDVVWALVPAVASTLENAVFAFNPLKTPQLTHVFFTFTIIEKLSLLVYAAPLHQSFHAELVWNCQKFRLAKNLEFIKSFWIAA